MTNRIESGEEPIELRRYVDALRRGLPLIAAIVIALAVSTYFVSSALPKHYKAKARIVLQDTSPQAQNSDTLSRELNTIGSLITTRPNLERAAKQVPGATAGSLGGELSATVDPNSDVITIAATDRSASRAAVIANAVANAFVGTRADAERRQAQLARASLRQELDRLKGRRTTDNDVQVLEQRISDLNSAVTNAGGDVQVAEPAVAPTSASSPHPMLNAGVGVVLALFLGVLVVLGRDQLTPRPGSPRELARLFELPLLVSIPYARRRRGDARVIPAIEHELYQCLATAVRFSLAPADGPHLVLVTSALHGEGKSTVTARLARALAQAGQHTLAVSADLRRPKLHELLDVTPGPGLSEVLGQLAAEPAADARALIAGQVSRSPGRHRGMLDVLASGRPPADPAELLGDLPLETVFRALRELDYRYVLIDSPALLGVVDARALARLSTAVLVVSRLDRVTLENVADAREALDRLVSPPLGLVVIGGRAEASPYYATEPVPALEDV